MRPPNPPPCEARLREDASHIFGSALAAVDPAPLVRSALSYPAGSAVGLPDGRTSRGRAKSVGRTDAAPPLLIAVGKAAIPMAMGALDAAPEGWQPTGIVLAPETASPAVPLPSSIRVRYGGHPLPTRAGARASRWILGRLEAAEAHDRILVLLSGGASSLLALPERGLDLRDLRASVRLLLQAGATIEELNTVRKHLERTKGGRLACAAAPAPTRVLVLSDVIGDRLDLIASGPFTPDPSTFDDALETVDRLGVRERLPRAVIEHLLAGHRGLHPESPKPGDPCFEGVASQVVGSVATAADGAAAAARRLGYRTHVVSLRVEGEARVAGARLGALTRALGSRPDRRDPPLCLIFGGETTVRIRGSGRGGRNQELALAAALEIESREGVLVGSFGTDGVDGPTDAAGAVSTGSTVDRARKGGLDPERALRENDSHGFFRELGDLIVTGPTGTNVMDLQLLLLR